MYLWLKALHVAAVVTWIGGMLIASIALSILSASPQPRSPAALQAIAAVRRWNRIVTTPAMLLVWGLGLAMAVQGNWFSSWWLMLKLAIVVALSALAGVQSGTLRRASSAPGWKVPAWLRYAAPSTLAAVLAIAILVVTKPF